MWYAQISFHSIQLVLMKNCVLFILLLWYCLRGAAFLNWDQSVNLQYYLILHVVLLSTELFFELFFKYFMLFIKYLIRLIKHGLECVVKVIFWHKSWWWWSNCGVFGIWIDVITGSWSCVYVGINNEEYSFVGLVDCSVFVWW